MKKLSFLSLLAFFVFSGFSPVDNGRIKITVSGLKNSKGKVLGQIFNQKEGFPEEVDKGYRKISGDITGKKAEIIVEGLPVGEYAFVVFHDENNNGEFDSNFLGIPKEGVGASNNAKGSFGPPDYDDAKFELRNGEVHQEVVVEYF